MFSIRTRLKELYSEWFGWDMIQTCKTSLYDDVLKRQISLKEQVFYFTDWVWPAPEWPCHESLSEAGAFHQVDSISRSQDLSRINRPPDQPACSAWSHAIINVSGCLQGFLTPGLVRKSWWMMESLCNSQVFGVNATGSLQTTLPCWS